MTRLCVFHWDTWSTSHPLQCIDLGTRSSELEPRNSNPKTLQGLDPLAGRGGGPGAFCLSESTLVQTLFVSDAFRVYGTQTLSTQKKKKKKKKKKEKEEERKKEEKQVFGCTLNVLRSSVAEEMASQSQPGARSHENTAYTTLNLGRWNVAPQAAPKRRKN